MTTIEFRKKVKEAYPHVKISIRSVSFSDLARGSAKCLTVTKDKDGEIIAINAWAKEAGIIPDGNIRFLNPRIFSTFAMKG
jgi:hypothetical protein